MADKPDCYKCKYRRGLIGSAHSMCTHPSTQGINDDPLSEVLAIFAAGGRFKPFQIDTGLNIKGNPHGIKHGWFNWPLQYDPVWLEQCDGFEATNEKTS